MSDGGQFDPYAAGRAGQASEKQIVDLPRKLVLLAAVVISLMLATRLVTYWLNISTAWPTIAASFIAIVASSVTLAGDRFRTSPMSFKPLLGALSALTILILVSTLTLFLDNRILSGRAVMPVPGAKLNDDSSAPFVIGVDAYASRGCGTYIFEASESELQPIPKRSNDTAAFDQWLTRHDAIQSLPYGRFTGAKLILNITGQTNSPVMIKDISFEVVSRRPGGVNGTVISGQCGDATTGRFIETNLDTDPPSIVASNTDPNAVWGSSEQELAPVKYPYTVKNGGSEAFYIIAQTHAYVAYNIRVDWIYQSHSGTSVVDNHGKPFTVAPPAPNAPPARHWG